MPQSDKDIQIDDPHADDWAGDPDKWKPYPPGIKER